MGYVTSVICIIAVAIIGWYAMKHLVPRLFQGYRAAVAITCAALVLGVSVLNMPNQVPAGHTGIVYSFGSIVDQVGEGLQFVLPWRTVVNASIQVQGHKFSGAERLSAFSSETQDVFVTTTVNVRVSPEKIQDLYRDVGPNYFDILVRPRVLQDFKDETVKYGSVDIAPHREDIRKAVRERLTAELQKHSIIVEDLLLDNISFSDQFQKAIEKKQANTQNALAEEANIRGKKAEADQAIETARGTAQSILINAEKRAEANRKLAASITPEYIQYLFADKLAPNVNVMMVPMGQQFILGSDTFKKPASGGEKTATTK